MEVEYTGFIFVEKETGIHIGLVPDLNYTSSYGRDFQEAKDALQEACELYTNGINRDVLPEVSNFDNLLEIPELPKKHVVVYIKV